MPDMDLSGSFGGSLATTQPMMGLVDPGSGGGFWSGIMSKIDQGIGKLDPKNNLLGMTPNQFTSVLGQLSQAISSKDSVSSRLGAVATAMGQAQLKGEMAKEQNKQISALLKDMLGKNPNLVTKLGGADGGNPGNPILDMTPEDFYKSIGAVPGVEANPTLGV